MSEPEIGSSTVQSAMLIMKSFKKSLNDLQSTSEGERQEIDRLKEEVQDIETKTKNLLRIMAKLDDDDKEDLQETIFKNLERIGELKQTAKHIQKSNKSFLTWEKAGKIGKTILTEVIPNVIVIASELKKKK